MNNRYDVIVVGTGVAGLTAALQLSEEMSVLMITKGDVFESNSYLAQGGMSTLKDESDFASYFEDTMKAGKYKNNPEAVEVMINESRAIVDLLLKLGVPFESNEAGLCYTREGAHSKARILHYQDITGEAITTTLMNEVKQQANVTVCTHTTMIDWVVQKGTVKGIVIEREGAIYVVESSRIILATGGIGGIFENSTNFSHITGDSIALAIKHGVKLKDMNYIQIHPTAFYSEREGRRFLITEAVRGEGGLLLNHKGKRFVDELLPRDIVSTAIYEEMAKEHMPYVFLSFENIGEERIKAHFPNIYNKCLQEGYDLTKEPIPVTPAQHYFMGGIEVDLMGRTSLKGLFAIGETSCNGVHGANRLASNSLLESMVFARRAAQASIEIEVDQENVDEAISTTEYKLEKLQSEYKQLVLDEIRRKDEMFYEQWCHNVNQCG